MVRPDTARRRKAYRLGFLAEWIAAGFLLIKGYRIIALRYAAHSGEIDIIALRRDVVVFVEVKARVHRAWEHEVGKAQLLHAAQALELRGIEQPDLFLGQLDVAVDRFAQGGQCGPTVTSARGCSRLCPKKEGTGPP